MANKFDTNPLDPDFPAKAKAQTASVSGYTAPPRMPFKTSEFPSAPSSITEEETRRFQESDFNAYAFQGGHTPALYKTTNLAEMNRSSSRKVPKIGLPENVLTALPYLPSPVGLVAGLVGLLLLPKTEPKVRFHAAQGLAAHIGIVIITTMLGAFDFALPFAGTANNIFWLVTTIMLIVFAIKAWKGKPVHIEAVDDLTNWLEEKIGPVKS